MGKKIFSVGWTFPGDEHEVEFIPFNEHRSLADADIVVFSPSLSVADYSDFYSLTHEGLKLLTPDPSSKLFRDVAYWRDELKNFQESGKTLFIFLCQPDEGYLQLPSYTLYNSYSILPWKLKFRKTQGNEIAFDDPQPTLRPLFEHLKQYFAYQVTFAKADFPGFPTFKQTKGIGVVGGRHKSESGSNLLFLPFIDSESPPFINESGGSGYWTRTGETFSKQLIKLFVQVEKALRSATEESVPPLWAEDSVYSAPKEVNARLDLENVEGELNRLLKKKQAILDNLREAQQAKKLLYAKGSELEHCVRVALTKLGFQVEHFKDETSEFDVVFKSDEGTFVGEVEGKDDSAVDVKKISQLMRNTAEYFAKTEEVAQGVLFGNGFRLQEPSARPVSFTAKCQQTAINAGVSLVQTQDLFKVWQRIERGDVDESYLAQCRQEIFSARGRIVKFPN